MQIVFTRAGGFANIPLRVTLDTASMPATAARELETLVDQARFFTLPPTVGDRTRLRDAHEYTVAISAPPLNHRVVIAGDAPPAVQALVDHLARAAKAARTAAARASP